MAAVSKRPSKAGKRRNDYLGMNAPPSTVERGQGEQKSDGA